MQIATVTVALGGDSGNTVQKYDVTPSEVAVLQLIHGNEAVTEIEPTGNVDRSSRAERERLLDFYGQRQPDGPKRCLALDRLFPGIAARLFARFDELEIEPQFYKTATRVQPDRAPAVEVDEPIVVAKATPAEDDDGIGDMPVVSKADAPEGLFG